jgi:cyclin B
VTTLWVASKYEEIYPPELNDFLLVSENKFARSEIIEMEKDILHTLNFMITVPSSFRFLQRYRRLSGLLNNEEVFYYAWYILEICLLDASLLRFKPS